MGIEWNSVRQFTRLGTLVHSVRSSSASSSYLSISFFCHLTSSSYFTCNIFLSHIILVHIFVTRNLRLTLRIRLTLRNQSYLRFESPLINSYPIFLSLQSIWSLLPFLSFLWLQSVYLVTPTLSYLWLQSIWGSRLKYLFFLCTLSIVFFLFLMHSLYCLLTIEDPVGQEVIPMKKNERDLYLSPT